MKKGRPAHTVSALADPALAGQVAGVLTRETGSLGVRGQTLDRWPQARVTDHVEVEGRAVRVKVSAGRVKVEHDDAVRVARQVGLPLREVQSRAEEAWRRQNLDLESDADRYAAAAAASGGPPAALGHLHAAPDDHDGDDHDHLEPPDPGPPDPDPPRVG